MRLSKNVGVEIRYGMSHPVLRLSVGGFAASLITAVVISFGSWYPAHVELQELESKVRSLELDVRVLMQEQVRKDAYKEALTGVIALEDKLGADTNQAALINNLNGLAQQNGITIMAELYEEGKRKGGVMPLHQEISIEGSYPGIRRFIQGINGLPTWTELTEGRLLRAKKREGVVNATLTLVTYRGIGK